MTLAQNACISCVYLTGVLPLSPLNHEGCRGCLAQHSSECHHHPSIAPEQVALHHTALHDTPTSRQASAGVVSQQQHSGRAPLHLPMGALQCCHQKHHFGFHNNPENRHQNWVNFLTLHMHPPSSWGKTQPRCWCHHQCPQACAGACSSACPSSPIFPLNSMTAGCATTRVPRVPCVKPGTFRLSFRPAVPGLGCWSCDRDAPGNVCLASTAASPSLPVGRAEREGSLPLWPPLPMAPSSPMLLFCTLGPAASPAAAASSVGWKVEAGREPLTC